MHYNVLRMLLVYSIRTPSTEYCGAGGLNTASTGRTSSTEGPDTASTGSMNTTEARVQAVPAVQTSEILEVLRVSTVFNPNILRVLAAYNASTRSSPVAHLRTFSANKWRWNYRTGAQMVELYFILRVHCAYSEYSEYSQYQRTECG